MDMSRLPLVAGVGDIAPIAPHPRPNKRPAESLSRHNGSINVVKDK
jgi:hypothetical protein